MATEKVKLFAERLKARLAELRLGKAEIGRRIGVSPSTVTTYIAGRNFTSRKVSKMLASELKCDENWLLGENVKFEAESGVPNAHPVKSLMKVPLVSQVTAGKGRDFEDVAAQLATQVDTTATDSNAFALEIDGVSMMPEFRPGDIVVGSPNLPLKEGKTVIAKDLGGRVYFKIFHLTGRDEITLESINPEADELGKKKFKDLVFKKDELQWVYPVWNHIKKIY